MTRQKTDFKKLTTSLNYLHVSELRAYCDELALSSKGKKAALVIRIVHFLQTGEKLVTLPYPAISVHKGPKPETLKANDLILKNAYKNDLKTRLFFKTLIGEYFHFTAFGIDWLEERWMQGKPATYQEFANMWGKEYAFRQLNGSTPKSEWAYIRFVKRYLKTHAQASREEILEKWEEERMINKKVVKQILKPYLDRPTSESLFSKR